MALIFGNSGAIRNLSRRYFFAQMALGWWVPFLFTVAQVLKGVFPPELHFFSPLGAGGAGATPRRMRTAYSRTRCLPHPNGWASAPAGCLCVALIQLHPGTFLCASHLSALRAAVVCRVSLVTPGVYPALFSNRLYCPCPGHFAECKRFRKSAGWE